MKKIAHILLIVLTLLVLSIHTSLIHAQSAIPDQADPVIYPSGTGDAAQGGSLAGIVKCGSDVPGSPYNKECGFDDFITLIQDVITYVIFYLIVPIATIIILISGFQLLVPGEKQASAISDAKNRLWKVLVGLFFILTAWLLVKFVTTTLGVTTSTDATSGPIQLLGN